MRTALEPWLNACYYMPQTRVFQTGVGEIPLSEGGWEILLGGFNLYGGGLTCIYKEYEVKIMVQVQWPQPKWIVLCYLRKFFFCFFCFLLFLCCTCMLYLINFLILSRPVPIFQISLSIISQLLLPYDVLFIRFFLNIWKGFKYLKELSVFLIKQKDD